MAAAASGASACLFGCPPSAYFYRFEAQEQEQSQPSKSLNRRLRRRSRDETPRRWCPRPQFAQQHEDDEDYGGGQGSNPCSPLEHLLGGFLSVLSATFATVGLLIGVLFWLLLLVLNVTFATLRWSFSKQGLFVLVPALLALLCLSSWMALEGNYGTSSLLFQQLEQNISEVGSLDVNNLLAVGQSLGGGLLAQRSTLDLAAEKGFLEAVNSLLAAGADVNFGRTFGPLALLASSSPLQSAATQGWTGVARALLARGANPSFGWTLGPFGFFGGASPLVGASEGGHIQVVDHLLNQSDPAMMDVNYGWRVGPRGLLFSNSPLWAACNGGHLEVARRLLEANASPSDGYTIGPFGLFFAASPLLAAIWNENAEMVRMLLQAGADIRHTSGEELRKAAALGNAEIVKLLLEAGAEVDAGGRAILGAARSGSQEVLNLLREAQRTALRGGGEDAG